MFWMPFSIFSTLFWSILSHFGSILGPPGPHFSMFLGIPVLLAFWITFSLISKKTENVKSSQNTAPVHGFRASPAWKVCAHLWKKASLFQSKFHQKSMKNRAQKLEKRFPWQKSIKHRFLAPCLGPRTDFWSNLGAQPGPQKMWKVAKAVKNFGADAPWSLTKFHQGLF